MVRAAKHEHSVVFNMTKIQVRKQFTTAHLCYSNTQTLFSIWRRYKFESNSQLQNFVIFTPPCCFQYDEDTSSKAIHNITLLTLSSKDVVFNMTKIQVRKQFTTFLALFWSLHCCFQYDEDTSSKAIHNNHSFSRSSSVLFSIWRRYKFESNSQRPVWAIKLRLRCFQYDEDTSSKAIHNMGFLLFFWKPVVFNMTKIQVRKQFTTPSQCQVDRVRCFQYDEDTSSKAIHNVLLYIISRSSVVFNMTKIQVRKQFTTTHRIGRFSIELFSIWRRYKFESNSQRDNVHSALRNSCFQYDEDTSSKAIHNRQVICLLIV